jgi:Zn-dependent M32 family carboxypeptidase
MDYQNKEHIKHILRMFEKLPDVDTMNKQLYDSLIETINESSTSNEEVFNTLKLLVMQLCEKYVTAEQSSEQRDNVQFTDEEREKYK